ncbi:cache domain-containing protein [Desulfatibacillum aliphaticivorans]|uniref:cache domain-containing protein n=1 Tax=Desulfatibacillum aliphaticivorans TaxID=218208 RepID=UPI0003F7D13A|nr:cache domain-containing protein [Desulfatibacillum aliphaticivorans]
MAPRDPNSLRNLFLRYMAAIALASLVSWTLVLVYSDYTSFKDQSVIMRQEFMDQQKDLLSSKVSEVRDYIDYNGNLTEKRLKDSLQSHVNDAHHIASGLYNEYAASEPTEKVQKMIKEALRPIRFNQGRGYYFAFNLDGVEELFADRPELEGSNMLSMVSDDGKYVVKDMLALCREKGEGFYTYYWTKPGEKQGSFPKIAYVKLFEPLGWVIGTGEYLDDYTHMVQSEVLNRIKDLRFEPAGYFFGSTFDGGSLFSAGEITIGAGSIQDLTDPNGVKIIQEQQKEAKKPGGGFVRYSWRKPGSDTPSPKISYVLAVPQWEWVIGAGVYLDSIEPAIKANEKALFKDLEKKILRSLIVLFILLAIVFAASRIVSGNIQASVQSLTLFFQQAARESISIDTDDLHFSEFQDIARQINLMLVERKHAEEELKASEIKWRSYVENAPYGIFTADREWRYMDANPAAERITGYSKEELLKRKVPDLVVKEENKDPNQNYNALLSQGVFNGESIIKRKDGEIRNISICAVRLSGDRFLAFVDDITEQKKAQQEIWKTNTLLTAVIKQAPFAVQILEEKDNLISVVIENDESARIVGESLQGRDDIDSKVSESLDARFFTIDGRTEIPLDQMPSPRAFRGDVVSGEEYLFRHADGKEIMVEASASPIFDNEGKNIAVCVTFHDVTEQRKTEQEKAELKEQIYQSQKMESVGRLAGGVAHDFNNMLSVILGFAEMALDRMDENHDIYFDLKEIHTAALRSADLTRQLLAFARKQAVAPKILDLNDSITNMLKMLRRLIGEDIELEWRPGLDLGKVKIDPSQLDQILANLCVNAGQAIEGGGKIIIQTEQAIATSRFCAMHRDFTPGEYCLISVQDNGQGMDDETLKRLFEPFYTTKELGKGTGLGLATIYGIVKQNNGVIIVDSKKDWGSVFKVYLPKCESPEKGRETKEAQEVRHGNGETILLVEDEESIMKMGERMLSRLGYKVMAASNPEDGLRLAEQHESAIDLLLTDVIMPGMNGKDLAEAVHKIRPDCKVLFMSGYTASVIEQHGVLDETTHFVQKPFAYRNLAKGVHDALHNG